MQNTRDYFEDTKSMMARGQCLGIMSSESGIANLCLKKLVKNPEDVRAREYLEGSCKMLAWASVRATRVEIDCDWHYRESDPQAAQRAAIDHMITRISELKARIGSGARSPAVVSLARAEAMLAAMWAGNAHRGMIAGEECPHCYEDAVRSGSDDPDPVWHDQCPQHRVYWVARQETYIKHLVDSLDEKRNTAEMSGAPEARRRLAKALRELKEVSERASCNN